MRVTLDAPAIITSVPPRFLRLAEGLIVEPIAAELQAQPDLWNQYRERTTSEASPHDEVGDVWLRYFPREQIEADPGSVVRPGHCEFYPAWDRLPALHGLVYALMAHVKATELGGILITRIPPGGRVKPHDDGHSWHARRMNTKVYIPLWGNARCVNRCLEDEVVMRVGEAWVFDNTLRHSVENNGDTERATLIVSMRTEPRPPVVRQPIEGMHLYAGSYVKSHVVPDAGTVMPQHAHTYPHMSFIASGAVRV
ncbi:MAG: aspartyl/asparaginyl beta-hydroxylase domain-containing protein, partial [Rhodospirillales bacterium]|nr:aspartyl/asparaginyl beta-hydroxylase domain-containing protein [Acetobacter sp.]